MNYSPVFDSQRLKLTSIDMVTDPAALAQWSSDLEIARRLRKEQPIRPLSEFEVRKVLEDWIKEPDRSNRAYLFALRTQYDDRLVGYIHVSQIMWVHGAGQYDMVIADPVDWAQYADEALHMGLRYAFDEMNLFRVMVQVEGHNQLSQELYTSAQFYLEVRQRQAVFHDGRYWDRLIFGLLRPEWTLYHNQQVGVVA